MATATIDKAPAKPAAKRPKTGGRVKRSLQEDFERQRMAAEIAAWPDDTTLMEDFAAIYLGISTAKLRELRGAINAASKLQAAAGPEIVKIFDKGAKGENQPVTYKLGALRAFQKKNTYSDSFNAAIAAGIRGWVSDRFPFFAEPEKRRAPLTLLANAWDFEDKEREANFKAAFDGELRFVWLTLAEAATARWRDAKRHSKLIKAGKGLLKQEIAAMSAALEASQIAAEAQAPSSVSRPSKKQR